MRKLKLEVDELQVETFQVAPNGARGTGTVRGHITYDGGLQPCGYTLGIDCLSARTGQPHCAGCQESGNATCVICPADTQTCEYCSYTRGGDDICYW